MIAYDRGGPGEIVENGVPDGWSQLTIAKRSFKRPGARRPLTGLSTLDGAVASQEALACRIEAWIRRGLIPMDGTIS